MCNHRSDCHKNSICSTPTFIQTIMSRVHFWTTCMMTQACDRCSFSCQLQVGKNPKHTLEVGKRKGWLVGLHWVENLMMINELWNTAELTKDPKNTQQERQLLVYTAGKLRSSCYFPLKTPSDCFLQLRYDHEDFKQLAVYYFLLEVWFTQGHTGHRGTQTPDL